MNEDSDKLCEVEDHNGKVESIVEAVECLVRTVESHKGIVENQDERKKKSLWEQHEVSLRHVKGMLGL